MTNTERITLRKLQDKVITKLQRAGRQWDDKLDGMYNHNGSLITLADLRDYLHPDYQLAMEDFLS